MDRWKAAARLAAIASFAALSLPTLAGEYVFTDVDRVVALSDIHGAHATFVETLVNAGVVDEEGHWRADAAHLVIVGDVLDRGADSRSTMDFLIRLEDEAAAAGGRVHVLLGNHEVLNLIGDMRYVSKGEYAAFAADETDEERDRWFRPWAARSPEATRSDFDKQFPRGYFAHRAAFAADGEYGSWLLQKPLIVVIDGVAFVHGGLSSMVDSYGVDGINAGRLNDFFKKRISNEVRFFYSLI